MSTRTLRAVVISPDPAIRKGAQHRRPRRATGDRGPVYPDRFSPISGRARPTAPDQAGPAADRPGAEPGGRQFRHPGRTRIRPSRCRFGPDLAGPAAGGSAFGRGGLPAQAVSSTCSAGALAGGAGHRHRARRAGDMIARPARSRVLQSQGGSGSTTVATNLPWCCASSGQTKHCWWTSDLELGETARARHRPALQLVTWAEFFPSRRHLLASFIGAMTPRGPAVGRTSEKRRWLGDLILPDLIFLRSTTTTRVDT